jgi:uncharacterized protein (TIGR03000 family)
MNMFRRISTTTGLFTLAVLGCMLSARPAAAKNQGKETALINVTVPADAKIWFDGSPTVQTGEHRQFVSPPLHPGSTYVYHVKVRWMEAGRPIEETRQVSVAPGRQIELNLTTPGAKEHRANYYDPDAAAPAISLQTLPSGPGVASFSQMGNNYFPEADR